MATSTATVLIPGAVVQQHYVIQEVRQSHSQYNRYLAQGPGERFCLLTEFPIWPSSSDALQESLQTTFERQAAPLLALNHPQLPRFTEAFRDRNSFFLAQMPPRGIPYRKLLKLRRNLSKALTEPEVIHLLIHLLPALEDLHSRKLIHSKLSPDSIVLPVPLPQSAEALCAAVRHEVPMLVELGSVENLARQLYAIQAQRSVTDMAPVARLGYAPPEQIQTGRIYPHSDFYGLAVTCLELLTGQAPRKLLDSHTLTWSWQAYTNLSQPFEEILSHMLSWQPGDRFANAQEILQALQAAQPGNSGGFRLGKLSAPQVGHSAKTKAGSILSMESWNIGVFRRPRQINRRHHTHRSDMHCALTSGQEAAQSASSTQLVPSALQALPMNKQIDKVRQTPQLPLLHKTAQSAESEQAKTSATTTSWHLFLLLACLGGIFSASTLLTLSALRSPLQGSLPQAGGIWQLVEKSNPVTTVPNASVHQRPQSGVASAEFSVPEPSTSLQTSSSPMQVKSSAPGLLGSLFNRLKGDRAVESTTISTTVSVSSGEKAVELTSRESTEKGAIAELLSSDIPIPIYLSATQPEQSIQGSLRILPSQTYFVIGKAGQQLTAQLEADTAQLTVLDSELRPRMQEWNATQWHGELEAEQRTLFRIEGSGFYQLELSLH